jgi:iduronate 2-sulfatase
MKKNKLSILFILCTLFTLQAQDKRQNVLFIISDDLNTHLGCHGHPLVKTPNLDKLAKRGTQFTQAYTQYPLCGPSRNCMLTGLYPNTNGIVTNSLIFRQTIPEAVSLPQAFRQAGYFAGRIGKMYHYGVPACIGTDGHDDPSSWELQLNPTGIDRLDESQIQTINKERRTFGGTLSWLASEYPDDKHTDGLNAQDAKWVLQRFAQDHSRPFFLGLGFFRPHTPYVAPKSYFDLYPLDQIKLPAQRDEIAAGVPAPALQSKKTAEGVSEEERKKIIQAYYASITFMDAQLGQVIDELDRLNLTQNTIIVFTSDHGYHLSEHGLWQKQTLFEEANHIPLIIVQPNGKSNQIASTPVGLIDLYPTLCSLTGVPAPKNLHGQDLSPILKDPTQKGRGWSLSQLSVTTKVANPNQYKTNVGGYSLRTETHRYTEWGEKGAAGKELYDHTNDPKEQINLTLSPTHQTTITDLSKILHQAIADSYADSSRTLPEIKTLDSYHPIWTPSEEYGKKTK